MLYIVQLRDKVLVYYAVVVKAHNQTQEAMEQALNAPNIGQEIQQCVAMALVVYQVLREIDLYDANKASILPYV